MKQRFTPLDIRAISNELNAHLAGKFVQNFYATQQRFLFIKFSSKDILLIEPGSRLHLAASHDIEISHFCKKLRETCRHTRVVSITQHGFDRIVIIDVQRFKIVIELFGAGNVLIIDPASGSIVDLQRPVPEIGMVKGTKYAWNHVRLDLSYARFCELGLSGVLPFENEFICYAETQLGKACHPLTATDPGAKEKVEKYLRSLGEYLENLAWFGEVVLQRGKPLRFHPFASVAERTCTMVAFNANDPQAKAAEMAERKIQLLQHAEIEKVLKLQRQCQAFHFSSFNAAVEYATASFVKASKKKSSADKAERIRCAQLKYRDELLQQAESAREAAGVMESERGLFRDILAVFSRVYEYQMEWRLFEAFYEDEKTKGNFVATAITLYDLERGTAAVVLGDVCVELDLSQSLNKNIEAYYSRAKRVLDKARKTEEASKNFVLKEEKKVIGVKAQARVPYWFERFHFFIASDGTLVIGGKNIQDNELIVKNHLEKNDLYFHCSVHGASSVVSKGRSPTTIEEAAYMALCFSKCWEEKMIEPVFYVEPSQVSKTAPTGEYLPRGSFAIAGKKTFVSLHRLEYGVAIMFREEGAQALQFTATPTATDILHAFPMAAPWKVIRRHKYRIRLCPGNGKKTQVAQEIMKVFCAACEGTSEERAVKAIGLDEYMRVVLSKSRISKEI